MADNFTIVFVEGVDFIAANTDQAKYFQRVISDSFCLLSWLIPDYEIRILNEVIMDESSKVKIFSKGTSERKFMLHQRKSKGFYYYGLSVARNDVTENELSKMAMADQPADSIRAEFISEDQDKTFIIHVVCQRNAKNGLTFHEVFLNKEDKHTQIITGRYNYFKPPCKKVTDDDGDYTDIQYYFIEPENRRYFTPEGYHLSLAFQGGGAKGVSYVGVYKAIKEMQARVQRDSKDNIPLPITSVIGSSAGGILSLAISAGIEEEDLIELCYMMDTLVEDRLFTSEKEAEDAENNPDSGFNAKFEDHLEQHFFSGQGKAVKNLLHNLGLMQDSLSDVIFQTLKEPSVQSKIVDLLKTLNPSIASLLTYGQPQQLAQGESIKNCCGTCCCCCYSNCWDCCGCYPCCKSLPGSSCFIEHGDNFRKVNIYGLLYAALMTGSAVQNILAYALSRFFGLQAAKQQERGRYEPDRPKKLAILAQRKSWFGLSDYSGVLKRIIQQAEALKQSYSLFKAGRKRREEGSVGELDISYLSNPLMIYAKALTLGEYYELIGVEFTCTSVDLQDRVERFFNHKTTPLLPICKAVQMTGSFPVAFMSLAWRAEWGKYYIHYDQSRRQIDLTGHHFTDGGLLANFPLKFLDNEQFRQKYLSHRGVPGKTMLFGFGLDKLADFPEFDNSEEVSGKMAVLVEELKYRLMYKLMLYLMQCGSKATLELKNSKVVSFLVDLVDALRDSDRNLNKQCFNNEIIQTTFKKAVISSIQDYKSIPPIIEKVSAEFKAVIDHHLNKQIGEFLSDELNSIYDRFKQYENFIIKNGGNQKQLNQRFSKKLSWTVVQKVQWRLEDNFLMMSPECIEIYQRRLIELKERYSSSSPFVTSATTHHQISILMLLYDLKKCLMASPAKYPSIKAYIKKNYDDFSEEYFETRTKITEKISRMTRASRLQQNVFLDPDQARHLNNLMYRLSPFIFKNFKKYSQPFWQKAPIINFIIEEETMINKNNIALKLRREIAQRSAKIQQERRQTGNKFKTKLHIILEAHYFSHYYYPNYIKIVEEVIANTSLSIDIISCTNYHALFGVLYALGLESSVIKKRLSEVQSLFVENPRINSDFESKVWMQSSVQQARTLLEREWSMQQHPFTYVQEKYNANKNELLMMNRNQKYAQLNNIENQFQASDQEMSDAFEKVLTYISGSINEVLELSANQRGDRFQQLLSMGKYKKANSKISKNGQRVLEHFLTFTSELITSAAETVLKQQQYTVRGTMNMSREILFKGLVLNSIISAFQYKLYIYNLLGSIGFDRNISLSKFYEACERKVTLNFNCINTAQQRFSTLNRITRPNMPLWAALMSAASLPYLEGEFGSRKEWELKENPDLNLDKADIVFRNTEADGTDLGNAYICANAISSLPLQFMTNKRLINSKLTIEDNPPVIEIAFAFQSAFSTKPLPNQANSKPMGIDDSLGLIQEQSDERELISGIYKPKEPSILETLPQMMEGKRRFVNCCDAIGYIFEYLCCCCCDAGVGSYFGDFVGRLKTLQMLNTRINAHDNLILHLYFDSLIKLPLRIDTLDFHKISTSRPDLPDTIRQAQLVVGEYFDTIQVAPNGTSIVIVPNFHTSIQFSRHRSPVYNENNEFFRVKFISYTKWRDFRFKYAIEYSTAVNELVKGSIQWHKIKTDHFDVLRSVLATNNHQILLKFTFYENKLISYVYQLSLAALENLQIEPARAFISFQNRKFYSKELKISTLNQYHPILGECLIKSCDLPRNSKYCSNLQCTAEELSYVLMKERLDICYQCKKSYIREKGTNDFQYNKTKMIAMECSKCKANYCLQCKISNFIVRRRALDGERQCFEFICPKNKGNEERYKPKYSPIIERCAGEEGHSKNSCHYCQKYSFKLWHEEGIVAGNRPRNEFCGLRVCDTCSLYISE